MTKPLAAAALAALLTAPMAATAGPNLDVAVVDVLPGWRTETGTHMAAIRVQLAPGWKTYWRAPGDAGIPAQFDWRGSSNLAAVRLHWPVPEVFMAGGLTSIGYKDQLVLPVELTPRDPATPIALTARIDMGVCEDICVPVSTAVAATLPTEATHRDARIRAALDDRPMTEREARVASVTCAVAPTPDGLRLDADIAMPPMGGAEFAVVEVADSAVWVSHATTARQGDRLHASVELAAASGTALTLDRSRLRITVLGQRGAVDIHGCD